MLKSIFLFAVFQLVWFNTYAQDVKKFTLSGTIVGRNSGKLYLIYSKQNRQVIDSAAISNEGFVFHGSIDEPTTAELTDDLKTRQEGYGNYLSNFYLEPGVMNLSAIDNHLAEAKLNGSKTNEDYQWLISYINPAFEKIFGLQNQMKADSLKAGMFSDSLAAHSIQLKNFLSNFVKSHPDSYIGIMATQRLLLLREVRSDSVLATFNLLTPRIKNTGAAKKLKEALVNIISSSIGHVAADFRRKDVNGKAVSLRSLRGNYVLLDFWASWCAPCRVQTPHLRKLSETYGSKGLKVVAISCDSKYDAWKKAIRKDSIESFINILSFTDSDMNFLKGHNNIGEASFEGELRKQFNLMPIPVYILIDPKGVVIGRYGGSEEESVEILDKKLIEVLGKG